MCGGDGRIIYVADYTTGLHTYRIGDAGELTHLDSHNPGGGYGWGVWGDGRFVYLAFGTSGMHSYGVDTDGTLTHIDSDDQGGDARDIWGDGTYVYMADGNYNGLRSYSVDNSGMITYLDQGYDGGAGGYGVWADGTYVYLADGGNTLRSYYVDSTGDLYLVDTDNHGTSFSKDVYGDGRFLYVANMDGGGILTYEVADNGMLTFIDSHDPGPAGWAEGVWSDGRFVYLADTAGGIHSYRVSDGVDQWVPNSGYVNSSTQASTTHMWNVFGMNDFRVVTENEDGFMSPWAYHEFFATHPNTAPSAPVFINAPIEALPNESVVFDFVSDDETEFVRHTVEKNLERAYINKIIYDTVNARYIAVGADYGSTNCAIWISDDLDVWDRKVVSGVPSCNTIIQNGGTYVIGGGGDSDPYVWESSDLSSWTSHEVDFATGNQSITAMIYDPIGSRYIAVGYDTNTHNAMAWESTDLVSWASHIVGVGTTWVYPTDIAYDALNAQFLVSGYNDVVGVLWNSNGADLSSWDIQTFPGSGWINSVTTYNGMYVLGGSKDYGGSLDDASVWTSTNLSSWTEHQLKDTNGSDVTDVVVNTATGEFLAVGYWNEDHAMVWSSTDITNWNEQELLSAVTDRRQIETALYSQDTGEFVVGGFEMQADGLKFYNVAVWNATDLKNRIQYGIDWDMSGGGIFTHEGSSAGQEGWWLESIYGDGTFCVCCG
jgi:6-phosphogluconolactonase (cycloisomerase 2 family)